MARRISTMLRSPASDPRPETLASEEKAQSLDAVGGFWSQRPHGQWLLMVNHG